MPVEHSTQPPVLQVRKPDVSQTSARGWPDFGLAAGSAHREESQMSRIYNDTNPAFSGPTGGSSLATFFDSRSEAESAVSRLE
ncbi:hypothetical protein ACC817_36280, partial [Rhizobium ruizarguesonis]